MATQRVEALAQPLPDVYLVVKDLQAQIDQLAAQVKALTPAPVVPEMRKMQTTFGYAQVPAPPTPIT